ncbi:MAG: hypothetical protein A2381_11810 [Bdellovibrionales bacterium RIFOXYB1_FULL_37_110]|nr:MAG: hypothetical protein A2181_05645 [Bdellovibrionales bacterium RIFOXYA1_FULL_38_20]OFZ49241.1 MAG: hypothetical protein A2417_17050 [Bdellovibrionales bacterium RIFOXYC1_FULL_37_79]OFZ58489.1 MAG: hypothetical protein A2381_11810 [Bdellovibrionales bacterium RIFOXYB1_FULL_37_110]OFZ61502.1 MAG: hypothetical protein A2577_00330 [Bdellovibrionales bacterium RIFOXYD1_FULL_36_51]
MIYKIFSGNAPIPTDILKQFTSSVRAQSYYYSRMALLECLQSMDQPGELTDLNIINHHHLEKFPNFLVSLSHTQNVGAGVIAATKECQSIGMDIEFCTRLIDPKTSKFFKTLHDQEHGGDNLLWLWVKKEASFKALSSTILNKTLVLTDIWIRGDEFGLIKNPQTLGKIILNEENVLGQKLLVAIALLF